MYLQHFGLARVPFAIAPDPRALYLSAHHREALAHLLYGLQGGGGVVLLTGEVGAGKTTVCRAFLAQLPGTCQVAYIFNPQLSVLELLRTVCQEFGVAVPQGVQASIKDHIDPLNAFLLASHAQGRSCLLVIDEAQQLSAPVLEQLRLLTNLETEERKLLQVVLIGQPELRELLAQPGLLPLAQRVIARYHLGPLDAAGTAAYVAHRLAVAGHRGALPFDRAGLRLVHRLSGGVPRRINLLCDRALLGAYGQGQPKAGVRLIRQAATEVQGAALATGRVPRTVWALAAGGLLLAGGLWWAGSGRPPVRSPASAVTGPGLPAASAASATPGAMATTAASATLTTSAAAAASAAPSAAMVASAAASSAGPALATAPGLAGDAPSPARADPMAPAASAAVPVPADPPLPALASLPRDEQAAWRSLGAGWAPALADGDDACAAWARQGWACWRATATSLALVSALDRPGLLVLRAADGSARPLRLLALPPQAAVLGDGQRRWRVPLDQLAGLWRGEFLTLWQPPEGYTRPLLRGDRGPAVDALARGLATLQQAPPPEAGQVLDAALQARLAGFQLAHGLKPDGLAGPTTFMQLARALGGRGPQLAAGR